MTVLLCFTQGWRQDLPDGGARFPDKGAIKQNSGYFSKHKNTIFRQNFPDGGLTLPNGGLQPFYPLLVPPLVLLDSLKGMAK